MKSLRLFALATSAFVPLFWMACTAARSPFSPTECNRHAGYDRGFVEGRGGLDPETQYSFQCREDLRAEVREGYREGYEKGHELYLQSMREMRQEMREERRLEELKKQPTPTAPTPPVGSAVVRGFHCFMTLGSRTFVGRGTTDPEAIQTTVTVCEQEMELRLNSSSAARLQCAGGEFNCYPMYH